MFGKLAAGSFALGLVACVESGSPTGAGSAAGADALDTAGPVDTSDTATGDTAGTADTAAGDTADTADSPPPAYVLPDDDLTDEVCDRVRIDYSEYNWYQYWLYQNAYVEDVSDPTGQARWHVAYSENVDWEYAHRTTYAYDDKGQRTEALETLDGDTSVRAANVYTYTPEGWEATDSSDSWADGSIDSVWAWTYDDAGRVVLEVWRSEPDDGGRNRTTTTWTTEGRTVVNELEDDGTVVRRETATYDTQDRPLTAEYDQDADGVTDGAYVWTRDDDGRLLSYVADGVGTPGEGAFTTYSYDDSGLLVTEARWDRYGSYSQKDYVYDSANLLTETWTTYYDGSDDERVRFTYDEASRLVLEEYASVGSAGAITYRTCDTWTYDAEDRLTAWERDWDEDGSVDLWEYYTFDAVPC